MILRPSTNNYSTQTTCCLHFNAADTPHPAYSYETSTIFLLHHSPADQVSGYYHVCTVALYSLNTLPIFS
jgi:hypothetical protein